MALIKVKKNFLWKKSVYLKVIGVLQIFNTYIKLIFFLGKIYKMHVFNTMRKKILKKSQFRRNKCIWNFKPDFTHKLIYLLKYRSNQVEIFIKIFSTKFFTKLCDQFFLGKDFSKKKYLVISKPILLTHILIFCVCFIWNRHMHVNLGVD